MKTDEFAKLWVRVYECKDKTGWIIRSNKGLFGQNIKAKSKEKAEVIRAKIKNNQEIVLEDLV